MSTMRARLAAVLLVVLPACAHAPALKPGEYPMDVRLEKLGGGTVAMSEYAGRPVLVSFFATWCMPCLAELPYLQQLSTEHPDLQIVAIAMDQGGKAVLEPFVERYRVPWPVLLADKEIYEGRSPFGHIVGIPATFLLDRRGRVVTAVLGMLDAKSFSPLVEQVIEGRRKGIVPPKGPLPARKRSLAPPGVR